MKDNPFTKKPSLIPSDLLDQITKYKQQMLNDLIKQPLPPRQPTINLDTTLKELYDSAQAANDLEGMQRIANLIKMLSGFDPTNNKIP